MAKTVSIEEIPPIKYNASLYCNLSNTCNLRCEYCWGILVGGQSTTPPINIQKFVRTLNETKRIVNVLFSGAGEPFLIPNIVEASREIAKRHYLSFNTNFVHNRLKELLEVIDPERIASITASLHLKELENRGLLDTYIHHYCLCMDRHIALFSSAVGYPPLLSKVAYYRQYFADRGISFSFNPFFGTFNGKQYPDAYTEEEMRVFELTPLTQYNMKGELCNAGYNHGFVNNAGIVRYCDQLDVTLGTIESGFQYRKKLIKCPFERCYCPVREFNPPLFKLAARKTRSRYYEISDYPFVVIEISSYRRLIEKVRERMVPCFQPILRCYRHIVALNYRQILTLGIRNAANQYLPGFIRTPLKTIKRKYFGKGKRLL